MAPVVFKLAQAGFSKMPMDIINDFLFVKKSSATSDPLIDFSHVIQCTWDIRVVQLHRQDNRGATTVGGWVCDAPEFFVIVQHNGQHKHDDKKQKQNSTCYDIYLSRTTILFTNNHVN